MKGKCDIRKTTVHAGQGKYMILGNAQVVADGIIVTIAGGTKPHVGSIAVALPRPGLDDPTKVSATTSVFNIPGHKDEEIARPAAQLLASKLNKVVVVVAGVHVDGATEEEVSHLITNSKRVTEKLLEKVRELS